MSTNDQQSQINKSVGVKVSDNLVKGNNFPKNKEDLIKIIKNIKSMYNNNNKFLNDNENEIYSSKAYFAGTKQGNIKDIETNIKFSCIENKETNELNIYFAGTKQGNIKDIKSDIHIVKKAYFYHTDCITKDVLACLPSIKYLQSNNNNSSIGKSVINYLQSNNYYSSIGKSVINYLQSNNYYSSIGKSFISNVPTQDSQEKELKTIFENFTSNVVDDFSKYSKITISGHSLGGHFANLTYFQLKEHFKNQKGGQDLINKLSVINIDGAADGYLRQEKENLYEKSDNNKIHNIVIGDNLINSFASKLGKQHNLIDNTKIYEIQNLKKFHSLDFIAQTITNKKNFNYLDNYNSDFNTTKNDIELVTNIDNSND